MYSSLAEEVEDIYAVSEQGLDKEVLVKPIPRDERIDWDDRESYIFKTVTHKIFGDEIGEIPGIYPLDDRYSPKQNIYLGQVLYDLNKNRYYIYAFSETENPVIREEYGREVSQDDLLSINSGWSEVRAFDINDDPNSNGRRFYDELYRDLNFMIPKGPYLDDNPLVTVKTNLSKFPILTRIKNVYFFTGRGPDVWTENDWDIDWDYLYEEFIESGNIKDISEEEFDRWWMESPFRSYTDVKDAPYEIKDRLEFSLDDIILPFVPNERKIVWHDVIYVSFNPNLFDQLIPGKDITLLEPPFLSEGDKVTFKSGEDGEGPMKKGVIEQFCYCDQWGIPTTDDWLRKLPWELVKLSEHIGDLLHYGTNVTIIDDDGEEWLVGGRWIFPSDDGGERPGLKEKPPTLPPPIIPPAIPDSEKEIIPPQVQEEELIIPPEEEPIIPPEIEEELIIPPEIEEEPIIPPDIEEVPPEEDILPPPIKPKKKKKKKVAELEVYA